MRTGYKEAGKTLKLVINLHRSSHCAVQSTDLGNGNLCFATDTINDLQQISLPLP